jgi:hypothetical protein
MDLWIYFFLPFFFFLIPSDESLSLFSTLSTISLLSFSFPESSLSFVSLSLPEVLVDFPLSSSSLFELLLGL